MRHLRRSVVAATAVLLGAILAGPAAAVVVCGATGEAVSNGDGTFTYCITLEWDFGEFAVPERIDVLLPELEDCEFYDPGNPGQADYLLPGSGTSAAQPGCVDGQGDPVETIEWVGEIALEDPFCWAPTLHIAYTNTGGTSQCDPLTADVGVFCFTSHGLPLPDYTYYENIVIRAGGLCLVCDYTGPLPDCNMWSPVEHSSWGTIKGLYR